MWWSRVLSPVLVCLVLICAAPTALADPVEVQEGAPDSHCEALVEGGCEVHLEGEATFLNHIFGIESTEARCHVEVQARFDEAGESEIYGWALSPGGHNVDCSGATAPACTSSLPWSGDIEETAVDQQTWTNSICIDPAETVSSSGNLPINLVRSGSQYHAETSDIRIGTSSLCEVTLDAETENDGTFDNIGINHV